MTWRDKFRPIIAEIISQSPAKDERSLRKALRERRPRWTKTEGHLAKTWRDEVNVQLGVKAKRVAAKESARRLLEDMNAGQLFLEETNDES